MKKAQFLDWSRAAIGESYEKFVEAQNYLWEQRLLDLAPDTLIVSRHQPTITLGARSLKEQLPHIRPLPFEWLEEPDDEKLFLRTKQFLLEKYFINLVRCERGGSVWYHDIGVLQFSVVAELESGFPSEIVYPLEETLFQTLTALSVPVERSTERDRNQSFIGVWSNGKKLGAIGVRIRKMGKKKISQFGAALNVHPYRACLRLIDPCGIKGAEATSIEEAMGKHYGGISVRIVPTFLRKFQEVFGMEFPESTFTEFLY